MRKDNGTEPLWEFPITATPDAPPEPADPMEMIARWQEESEAGAAVHADVATSRTRARR